MQRDRWIQVDRFCINHISISLATKTVESNVCSATNPTTLARKLKMAPTVPPAIAGSASRAFPASLLRLKILK